MKKSSGTKIVLCICLLTIGVWHVWAQSQPEPSRPGKYVASDVGRDNPFAEIAKPQLPIPANIVQYPDPNDTLPELFVETITLKFLDPKNVQSAIANMSSEYGSIVVNQKNNSLIICDTKEHLAKITGEIRKADKTPEQIMIEVVILDVQLEDDTEMGINWDLLSDERYDVIYRQNFTTSRLRSTIEDADTIGNATAFNTTGFGGDFSLISGTIRNVVHLIQQKKDAEILASPRAMMVSGESANIKAVEEIPYEEITDTSMGGASALTSTKFKEVGITLDVTAVAIDQNDIFLTVETEQNVKTGESRNGVPVVDTRRAKTSLLLKDGQIVVMGGLRRQEKTTQIDQIPLLGDLPIIGELFKSTNVVTNNSELIVFLSPHIYRGEPIPDDAMNKVKEIKDKPMLTLPTKGESKEERNQPEQRAKEGAATHEQPDRQVTELEPPREELAEVRGHLDQSVEQQRVANEQLQIEIAKHVRTQAELKEYHDQLDKRLKEQAAANKQLKLQITEAKGKEDKLRQYADQFDQGLKEQTLANEQLQLQIDKGKQTETRLKQHYDQLQQDITRQTAANEQLSFQISECEQTATELQGYHHQLQQRLKIQTAANKQLQIQITEAKRKEDESKQYHADLEKYLKQQTAANRQLEQVIAECRRVGDQLRAHHRELEQRIREATGSNEELQQQINKHEEAEQRLREYYCQLAQRVNEQAGINDRLVEQVTSGKPTEDDVKEHSEKLDEPVKNHAATNEQPQHQVSKSDPKDTDASKKILMEKMRTLRNSKDGDVTGELLSTLVALEKILKQEIQECTPESRGALAGRET